MTTLPTFSLIHRDDLTRIVERSARVRDYEASGLSQRAFCRQHHISRDTLARDIAAYRLGPTHLADKRRQSKGRPTVVEDRFAEWMLGFVANHPAVTPAGLHRALLEKAEIEAWQKVPSAPTVRRFYNRVAPDILKQIIEGPKARSEEAALSIPRKVASTNERWQMDFTEMDAWTFLPNGDGKLFKPWLVTAIDCHSRVILWAHLCKTVSAKDVIKLLKTAIKPKQNVSMPFAGRPGILSLDNAPVYEGDVLESLIRSGIEVDPIPKDCPEADGKQERFFRTMFDGFCRTLPGYTKQFRGKARAQKEGVLPFSILQRRLLKYIACTYHLKEHRSLGTTPWEAYHDGLENSPIPYYSPEEADLHFRLRESRKVHSHGVEVGGRRFLAPCLEGMVGETVEVLAAPDAEGKEIPVFLKGKPLGMLTHQPETEMADAIRETRLARTIEISALRKQLKYGSKDENPDPDVVVPPTPVVEDVIDKALHPDLPDACEEKGDDANELPDLPTQ